MAIKGNNSSSSGGGNRGRPYGVMLLIAFGAALLGVLVVHKLRERRIFNILVTEKEQQLYSLHLLLQVGYRLCFFPSFLHYRESSGRIVLIGTWG
ncbi:hypothetical protein LINGRAHAP2_LOCUS28820 [Linum grandiflorum]